MIKRINPFIILGILSIVLLILIMGVHNKKESIRKKNIQLASYKAKAKMYQELKRGWSQKNSSSKLNAVTSSSKLTKPPSIKRNNDTVIMSIPDVNKNNADKIIKNFFNEPFEIRKFSIERMGPDTVNMRLEAAL